MLNDALMGRTVGDELITSGGKSRTTFPSSTGSMLSETNSTGHQ